MPLKDRLTFLEALLFLILSRLLIVLFSFKKIAQKLGEPMKETSFEISDLSSNKSRLIAKMIKKASAYAPFRTLCFEQALALKLMLKQRGIACTIYFGIKKNENSKLKAHAWTRVGKNYLTGKIGKEKYQLISTFG